MSNCDCALRSFWDGPCEEHALELLQPSNNTWADYTWTAEDALKVIKESDDPAAIHWLQQVDKLAQELAYRAGEQICQLVNENNDLRNHL